MYSNLDSRKKKIMKIKKLEKTKIIQKNNIVLNSGHPSDFKIECDALTDEDWECLAYLISKQVRFDVVIGVPTGGLKLQKALEQYATKTTHGIKGVRYNTLIYTAYNITAHVLRMAMVYGIL